MENHKETAELFKKLYDEDKAIEFCQSNNLIPKEKVCCKKCNMSIRKEGNYYYWKCQHQKISIRIKTMFQNIKMKIGTYLQVLLLFWLKVSQINISFITGISEHSISVLLENIRKVFKKIYYKKDNVIGGFRRVIEVDETLLRKRKYNKGRVKPQQWIVGGIERTLDKNIKPKVFLEKVKNRNKETLSNVIRRRIAKNSRIHTDEWKGYQLKNEEYEHLTVNHSKNFVDPITKCHTNGVEAMWSRFKKFLPKFGIKNEKIDDYCAEYEFRNNYNNNFITFLQTISQEME